MNTISSVYYGWAWLAVCGGGAYYFAKRSINTDRAARAALEAERRAARSRAAEAQWRQQQKGLPEGTAATKSRFEASEPYISPKGDRFSTIGREVRDDKG